MQCLNRIKGSSSTYYCLANCLVHLQTAAECRYQAELGANNRTRRKMPRDLGGAWALRSNWALALY